MATNRLDWTLVTETSNNGFITSHYNQALANGTQHFYPSAYSPSSSIMTSASNNVGIDLYNLSKANGESAKFKLSTQWKLRELGNIGGTGTLTASETFDFSPFFKVHALSVDPDTGRYNAYTGLTYDASSINHSLSELSLWTSSETRTWSDDFEFNCSSYDSDTYGHHYDNYLFGDSTNDFQINASMFNNIDISIKGSKNTSQKVEVGLISYTLKISFIESFYVKYYKNNTLLLKDCYQIDPSNLYTIGIDASILGLQNKHQIFHGWELQNSTLRYSAGEIFQDGDQINNVQINSNDKCYDYQLQALIKEYCQVRYHNSSGSNIAGGGQKENLDYFSFNGTEPSKTGYIFKGWTNKSDCNQYELISDYEANVSDFYFIDKNNLTSTQVTIDKMSGDGTTNVSRFIDLYPVFQKKYKIIFNKILSNATFSYTQTNYNNKIVNDTINTPTAPSINTHKFIGWALDNSITASTAVLSGSNQNCWTTIPAVADSQVNGEATENGFEITYYAVWQERDSITIEQVLPNSQVTEPAAITVTGAVASNNNTYYFDPSSNINFSIAIKQENEIYFIDSVTANTTTNLITNGNLAADRKTYTSGQITAGTNATAITITITYIEGLPIFYPSGENDSKRAMYVYWEDTRAIGLYYENTRLL